MILYHYDSYFKLEAQMLLKEPDLKVESGPLEDGNPIPDYILKAKYLCIYMHPKVKVGKAGVNQQYDRICGTYWALGIDKELYNQYLHEYEIKCS